MMPEVSLFFFFYFVWRWKYSVDNKIMLRKCFCQHSAYNLSFLCPFSTMICITQQSYDLIFDSFLEQQLVSFLWKLTHLRVFQDQYNQSSGYKISKLRHTCIYWFHMKKANYLLTLHPLTFWAYLFPSSFSCAVYPSFRILGWSLVLTCKKSWSLFKSYNTN